jgi:hypothetical protein
VRTATSRAASKQQVGDVDTRQEQQQRRRREHDQQRRSEVADNRRNQRLRDEHAAFVARRIVPGKASHHHRQLAAQPLQRRARLHPDDRAVAMADILRVEARVRPQVGAVRYVEVARRDANHHRRRKFVEAYRFADNLRVAAEPVGPGTMRQDYYRRRPLSCLLLVGERRAERHRQAEQLEEAVADHVGGGTDRRRVVAQQRDVERRRRVGHGADNRDVRRVEARDLGRRDEAGREAAVGVGGTQRNQLFGVDERQRPQQGRVDGAENRRRRADPNRQRADRRERERRRAGQLAHGVAKILDHSLHAAPPRAALDAGGADLGRASQPIFPHTV